MRLSFENLFGSQLSAAFWMQNVFNNKYRLFCADNLNSIDTLPASGATDLRGDRHGQLLIRLP